MDEDVGVYGYAFYFCQTNKRDRFFCPNLSLAYLLGLEVQVECIILAHV